MPLTDIEICARALEKLGAEPIQSFEEDTQISTTCKNIYPVEKGRILCKAPWKFSLKQAQLSRQVTTPLIKWKYQYTMPADKLHGGMMEVYEDNGNYAFTTNDYTIVGDVLMSNSEQIFVTYQFNVNENKFPDFFTGLMVQVMMAELCMNVTQNSQSENQLKQETYGTPSEGGLGGHLGYAMNLDSRDTPTVEFTDFPIWGARFGGI